MFTKSVILLKLDTTSLHGKRRDLNLLNLIKLIMVFEPKSESPGGIHPRLLNKLSEGFAFPLKVLFNKTLK